MAISMSLYPELYETYIPDTQMLQAIIRTIKNAVLL
jgi:hypothetical protein